MFKKIFSILCCILIIAILAVGCSEQKQKTTLRINEVTHSIFYAPFYAAINLGYFDEEGLEIELTNGGGSDKSMTALLSGHADIGLMGPETAVYVCNEGREDHAVVIGQLTKRDGSFLLGKQPDPEFTWEKLRGTSIIGGRKGGMPQMMLEYVMKKNNIIPNVDATVRTDVQFDLMGGAFIGGEDDYVALFEPVASTVELASQGYIVASIGQESGEVPYTCFMVLKSFAKKNADTIDRFLRALYKSQQWIKTASINEIAQALAPSFPDNDETLLKTVIERYRSIDVWTDSPAMEEEAYNRLIEIITDAGIISQSPDFNTVADNSFAKKLQN